MLPSKYLIAAIALIATLGASGVGGWTARGWYEGSRDLTSERAARSAEIQIIERFNHATEASLKALEAAKASRREVVREVTKLEYRDRPCLEPDALRLLNAAAQDIAATPAAGPVP